LICGAELQGGDNGNLRAVLDWGTTSFRASVVDEAALIGGLRIAAEFPRSRGE